MTHEPTDPAFRCSVASELRDEEVAGSASVVRAFVLLEFSGAWGVDALRDARLPDGLGAALAERARETRVRVLLARRPDRRDPGGRPTVVAAHTDPRAPWLETARLDDVRDVLDLDLAALRAGRSLGLPRSDEPVFAVCTHGRHDACCAERGRPVAAALAAAHPEHAWEVSHLGGDRWAANLLVLPDGLYYGRVDEPTALAVTAGHTAGEVDLDHLRGRTGLGMAAQYAEVALRRQLGVTRLDAVRPAGSTRDDGDPDVTVSRFDVGGDRWVVRVRAGRGEPARLTCRAERDNRPFVHALVDVRRT